MKRNVNELRTGDTVRLARRLRASVAAVAVSAASLAAGGPALAQAPVIEEVVVTARFREENLQSTPLAITALTSESLIQKSANNVVDVARWAPNVTIDALGAGYGPTLAASIRGMGLGDFKAVYEPAVSIYVDDVVLGRPTGAILDLLDLERVEVLRGPQGTLFGRNAVGGVIRMISKKPEGGNTGFIEGTTGSADRLDVRGSFDTTLVEDKVFARFSFSSKQREGYTKVLDFACAMREAGTPELAGYGDGIGGWIPDPDGFRAGPGTPIMVTPGSDADNAFAIPSETSTAGTDRGCLLDTMGDENVDSGRAVVRWVASNDLEITLTGDVSKTRQKGPNDHLQTLNPDLTLVNWYNNRTALPNYGVPWDERFLSDDPWVIYSTFEDSISGIETPNVNNITHWGVSGKVEWDISDTLNATLITAYREFDAFFGRDSDGSPLNMNHTLDTFRDNQFSTELRLNGTMFNGMTEWTVGGFYFTADDYNSNISILFPPDVISVSDIDRIDDQEAENYAGFLHTVTDLTEKLTLTAGVRYTHDEKDVLQTRVQRDGVTFVFPPTPSQQSSNRLTPSVSLSYQFTDELMGYASYARGFRGGGFNPRPSSPATVGSFGPEDLDAFEAGFKSDLFDNRVRFNTAAFFMIHKDLQLTSVVVPEGEDTPNFLVANAGKAHIYGVEMDIQANLTSAWTVDAAIGYLGFKYKDLGNADPEVIAAAGGNPLSQPDLNDRPTRAPEWTASLGSSYTVSLGNDAGMLTFRGDVSYQSRSDFAANNLDRASQSAYALVNARITWDSPDDAWSLSVFGTNLTDKLYSSGKLDFQSSLGGIQTSWGRPREWGVSVKRRF